MNLLLRQLLLHSNRRIVAPQTLKQLMSNKESNLSVARAIRKTEEMAYSLRK